jgi:membrane-associated protein
MLTSLPLAVRTADWFFDPEIYMHWLGPFVLLGVAIVIFAESGLIFSAFLPGDTMLFTYGLLTATGFIQVPIWISVPVLFLCAFAGDQTGYAIGRKLGPPVFSREKSRIFNPANIGRTSAFFDRHGPKAVILARFIPYIRTFVPISAGVGKMPYRRFVLYNFIGAVLWAVGITLIGYFFGSIPAVAQYSELAILTITFASLLPLLIEGIRGSVEKRRRARAAEPAAAPAMQPAPAVAVVESDGERQIRH